MSEFRSLGFRAVLGSHHFLGIISIRVASTTPRQLWDFGQFKVQLGQSPVLTAYVDGVAWMVPGVEYLLALLLLFNGTRLVAFYGSLVLMVMFTTYILLVLNFSDYIPCSCGGVLEDLGWTEHIVFNLFFVALAIIGIILLEAHPTLLPEQCCSTLLHTKLQDQLSVHVQY